MLLLELQKIASGFFLYEAEHKTKNEKMKKRQDKLLQSVKTTLHSSSGNTTNSDEEK